MPRGPPVMPKSFRRSTKFTGGQPNARGPASTEGVAWVLIFFGGFEKEFGPSCLPERLKYPRNPLNVRRIPLPRLRRESPRPHTSKPKSPRKSGEKGWVSTPPPLPPRPPCLLLGAKIPSGIRQIFGGASCPPHGALCLKGGVRISYFLFSCCLPSVGEIFQRLFTKEKPKRRPVGIGAF